MVRQFSATVEQLIRDNMAWGNYASEDELLLDALESLEARRGFALATPAGVRVVDSGEAGFGFDDAMEGLSQPCHVQSQA